MLPLSAAVLPALRRRELVAQQITVGHASPFCGALGRSVSMLSRFPFLFLYLAWRAVGDGQLAAWARSAPERAKA